MGADKKEKKAKKEKKEKKVLHGAVLARMSMTDYACTWPDCDVLA
jgi:transcription antitermination factor NusG